MPVAEQPKRKNKRERKGGLMTLDAIEREDGVPYTTSRDLVLGGHLPRVRLGDSRRIWVRREDWEALKARSVQRSL